MHALEKKVLFIDCQTTGIRPPGAQVIEWAWGWGSALGTDLEFSQSHLVRLEFTEKLPEVVTELTGLRAADLAQARPREEVFRDFIRDFEEKIKSSDFLPVAVIHYAQFEKPFLMDMFAQFLSKPALPFLVVCSHQITRKIFPHTPSRNIRALAGFLGTAHASPRRSGEHLQTTFEIWQKIYPELKNLGLFCFDGLQAWLETKVKTKSAKKTYAYRIDKSLRLSLPENPGVYRMLNQKGDILYIGKATSLRDRVNSYFRGVKNRDRKKMEMLAQAWSLETTECASALEAALLESDLIKTHNPPYNIALKTGRRQLVFYNDDFSKKNSSQSSDTFNRGPFRPMNPIEQLCGLKASLEKNLPPNIFYQDVESHLLTSGFEIFNTKNNGVITKKTSVRQLLALALKLHRREIKPAQEKPEIDIEDENSNEDAITPAEVADKFHRLFLRAASDLLRSKLLTRLLNSQVHWETSTGQRSLKVHRGQINGETQPPEKIPWQNLAISDYDRMSVLLSELQKTNYQIHPSQRNSK